MSLNKEALEHVEELALAATNKGESLTPFPTIALPGGMQLHDLEQYQPGRNQYRGTMSTYSIDDFGKYANKQDAGDCYIDRDEMSAEAIFDIGNVASPGHCKHRASIQLITTAAYRAIKAKDGARVDQQELAEFLEDWHEEVTVFEKLGDETPMDLKAAADAVRNVTITEKSSSEHGVMSFSRNKSAIEQLNATSKEKPLPGAFTFKCVPYNGLEERTFTMRISMVIRKHDEPVFVVRFIQYEAVQEKMQDEFIELIGKAVDEKIHQYLGTFSTRG